MAMVRYWIEPVVAAAQFAGSFYDTGLLMVTKKYYNQMNTTTNNSSEDVVQKSISNFYIIYNLILKLTPLLSSYFLATCLGNINKKITLCVPLVGYLVSSVVFLFVILWDWPIEVMYGSAAFNGLTGWSITYWSGVMIWASLGSSESQRSIRLITNECVYGIAGFAGSLISGHVFTNLGIGNHQGVVLTICSIVSYTLCLLYIIVVLRIPHSEEGNKKEPASDVNEGPVVSEHQHEPDNIEYTEHSRLLDDQSSGLASTNPSYVPVKMAPSKLIIILLLSGASLYNASVNGAEDVISLFVLKEPLRWGPVEVGYGNAAGYMVFITSFLGVFVFSKYLGDLSLIIIGMISFWAGILTMAFATKSYLYYIARVGMMFSLIPVPTIRSILSKHVQESSYGKIYVVLQMIIVVMAVMASTAFIEIYQASLDWFKGFSFIVIFVVAFISFIPIR
ncbi:solute carrier family 46 member 2-like [Pelodytes ibericus]